ncbi:MAG TPA: cobalamin-binding protein, partial [Gammaproteobacteria bacterium]
LSYPGSELESAAGPECSRGRSRFTLRGVLLVLGILTAPLQTAPAHAELRVTDDLGHSLMLHAPARRIVSLSPHITELLFAAGAGGRIVAAVEYSDYPPEAVRLPRLGDAARIDLERLLALEPDLVIAWASGTPARELETLRRLGVPLYLSEPRRLETIGAQLRAFGELAGTTVQSEAAAQAYESQLAALRARYAGRPRGTVFYQLALQPLLTVNGAHIINDVLDLCGAVNPFAALPALTPHVAVEAVLAARPAAVILALYPGEAVEDTERFWRHYRLPQTTRFIGVPGDYIHRATPRILEGVRRICDGLDADLAEKP